MIGFPLESLVTVFNRADLSSLSVITSAVWSAKPFAVLADLLESGDALKFVSKRLASTLLIGR